MATTAAAALASTAYRQNHRATSAVLTEITYTCSDGIQLAAQKWNNNNQNNNVQPNTNNDNNDNKRRVLCLHGWMDNARSFHHIGPELVNRMGQKHYHQQQSSNVENNNNIEVIALDFPGHGLSSHLHDPPTILAETVYYVAEFIKLIGWENNFILCGHSMGAAVSCLYAAAFPEQVQQLILLEGVGPLARNQVDVAKHVRHHVERRLQSKKKEPRIYPNLDVAIKARCQTARNFPGNQYLSDIAAKEMVIRGTRPVVNGEGGYQFRHDPRLQWPSIMYFSQEQVEALYDDIQCPTAILLAVDGWPFDEEKQERTLNLLKPVVFKTLPGSHHFHADPDTADAVVTEIVEFISRY